MTGESALCHGCVTRGICREAVAVLTMRADHRPLEIAAAPAVVDDNVCGRTPVGDIARGTVRPSRSNRV